MCNYHIQFHLFSVYIGVCACVFVCVCVRIFVLLLEKRWHNFDQLQKSKKKTYLLRVVTILWNANCECMLFMCMCWAKIKNAIERQIKNFGQSFYCWLNWYRQTSHNAHAHAHTHQRTTHVKQLQLFCGIPLENMYKYFAHINDKTNAYDSCLIIITTN